MPSCYTVICMSFEKKESLSPLSGVLRALCLTGFATALFLAGYTLGKAPAAYSENGVPGEGGVAGIGDTPAWLSQDVDFRMFWEVWKLVENSYVDQPVSEKSLYYGSLLGMLGGLGDQYSQFFDTEMAEAFNQQIEGTFYGIGAELGLNEAGAIVVIAPFNDAPAGRAGILAGDAIAKIDGVETVGMTVNEAVQRIRGELGTPVTLTIVRSGGTAFDVAITRDEIKIDSVKHEIREDGVGVIEIAMFNDDTVYLFEQAAQEMVQEGVTDLVIDLRNNPGGYFDGAIDLAAYWIEDQTAVMEEIRGVRTEFKADGIPRLKDMNTVVLVNGGSASAAEILAGALQDYGFATLIGEKTFGKGSVQEYHELPDGSAVKITVARWLTPLGRSIEKNGITPDVVVEFTLEDFNAGQDPQLEEALDILASQ